MIRKTIIGVGAAIALLLAGGTTATADEHTVQSSAVPIRSTIITEVTPMGFKVTGLAVEYDAEIDLGSAEINPDAFEVNVVLSRDGAPDVEGDRTVLKGYTNSEAGFADAQVPGRYVILELDENDATAAGTWNDGQFTNFYDLDGTVTVEQSGGLVGQGQTVPANPGNRIANSAAVNLIVDDYEPGHLSAQSGVEVPYQLYRPAIASGEKAPLVVTLHGHGESGTNNFSQIAGNQISVAFADPSRQSNHTAFVLSPQAAQSAPGGASGWWNADVQAAVIELIEKTLEENPQIDTDRVYITGLSMGGYGSWGILQQRADLFAGAIIVAAGGGDEEQAADFADLPIWALNSEDDFIVQYDVPGASLRMFQAMEAAGIPVTWSEWSGIDPQPAQDAAAQQAWESARENESKHLFTTLPPGTTPLFPHATWIPTYTNDVIIAWLFDQSNAPELIEVTPADVSFNDQSGTENDTFTVPAADGVEYLRGEDVIPAGTYPGQGTVTITARALEGYVLAEGAPTSWSHTFSAAGGGSTPTEPVPTETPGGGHVDPDDDLAATGSYSAVLALFAALMLLGGAGMAVRVRSRNVA